MIHLILWKNPDHCFWNWQNYTFYNKILRSWELPQFWVHCVHKGRAMLLLAIIQSSYGPSLARLPHCISNTTGTNIAAIECSLLTCWLHLKRGSQQFLMRSSLLHHLSEVGDWFTSWVSLKSQKTTRWWGVTSLLHHTMKVDNSNTPGPCNLQ